LNTKTNLRKDLAEKKVLASAVIKHHFGKSSGKLEFKPAGITNFVFESTVGGQTVIIRIASDKSRLNNFIKEQWAVEKARKRGIPVAEILEVGIDIIGLPYMLQQKLNGEEAIHHPERFEVLRELGRFAKIIHSIPTTHFGNEFNWNHNKLSKNQTWKSYLDEEWHIAHRMQVLKKIGLLKKMQLKQLTSLVAQIRKWKDQPSLNHGDLRLKNVIVDKKGKILGLIDWENCISTIAPYWDLSIALHDLSIDARTEFLKGYGIKPAELTRISPFLKAINVLNYAPSLEEMARKKDKTNLAFQRLRLQGSLDLFI
jgi:aminoglycoside phosphotransferase (APT) family kinase protein